MYLSPIQVFGSQQLLVLLQVYATTVKLLGDEELEALGLRMGDRVMLRKMCAEAAKSELIKLRGSHKRTPSICVHMGFVGHALLASTVGPPLGPPLGLVR